MDHLNLKEEKKKKYLTEYRDSLNDIIKEIGEVNR